MQLVFNAERKLHTYINLTVAWTFDESFVRTKNEFSLKYE